MFSYFRTIIFLAIVAGVSYIGWGFYRYFTVQSHPTFSVVGIEPQGSYSGDITASIKGQDAYKVARVSLTLDDKPLVSAKIGKQSFDYPFTVPAKNLSAGPHTLSIELANGAYHQNTTKQSLVFIVDNTPLQVAFVKNESGAQVFQGRTLHVQYQANKKLKEAHIKVLAKMYPCFLVSDRELIYECFVPIDCEEVPGEYVFTITSVDPVGQTVTLEGNVKVVPFNFKKQTLRIDPEKMKIENEAGLSEKQFEADVERLAQKSPHEKLWRGTFVTPIEITDPKQITTEFGVIRATQERGLKQHKALDVYAMPKSVVWATQDGVVVLKDRYAHSGNTVIIDHGWGVLSLFFHLDRFFASLEVGDKIKKGNPIGTLGKTGYATGYHLHWEMRVGNVAIDPMEWTKPGF